MRICATCGTFGSKENRLEIHHRDRNRKNNDSSNLVTLCRACHNREHGREFIPGERKQVVSFSLFSDHLLFIHEQADRLGTSKSEYLRSLLFREMAQEHETSGIPIGATVNQDGDAA